MKSCLSLSSRAGQSFIITPREKKMNPFEVAIIFQEFFFDEILRKATLEVRKNAPVLCNFHVFWGHFFNVK